MNIYNLLMNIHNVIIIISAYNYSCPEAAEVKIDCAKEAMATWSGDKKCGLLIDEEGPFKEAVDLGVVN